MGLLSQNMCVHKREPTVLGVGFPSLQQVRDSALSKVRLNNMSQNNINSYYPPQKLLYEGAARRESRVLQNMTIFAKPAHPTPRQVRNIFTAVPLGYSPRVLCRVIDGRGRATTRQPLHSHITLAWQDT